MGEPPTAGATLADPVEEAVRLMAAADEEGVRLRAVGGVALCLRSPSLRRLDPPRPVHDIDLVAPLAEKRAVGRLLGAGYEPHRRFNVLAGDRLIFEDPQRGRRVDVFLDRIEMCHRLDLRGRVALEPRTVALADLLLTKLQIVRPTERDVVDVAGLLADHDLADGAGGPERIDLGRIEAVCCGDWGWWRTVTGNLSLLEERWASAVPRTGPDVQLAAERATRLRDHLVRAPKTVRWRARAVVGERVSWYLEPEEVG